MNLDPSAEERKKDHIELAFQSQLDADCIDNRFYYEPLLSGHPQGEDLFSMQFLKANFRFPIWVSSMTGGTAMAATINKNLALVCKKYGLGMGLGSCRSLLNSDDNFSDFDVRKYMEDQPLYANLGIAQVESLVENKAYVKISSLLSKLQADGLIIHINPLQEWTQPEGDRYFSPPIETIQKVIDHLDAPIIVKEVGQGMGIQSLRALLKLPLLAIDFAANGGTNFSKLELLRSDEIRKEALLPIVNVGHNACEMVNIVNFLLEEMGSSVKCRNFIISGGVRNFLDGYYLTSKLQAPSIYGMASGFLKHARGSFEEIDRYVSLQTEGLKMAKAFLTIKT